MELPQLMDSTSTYSAPIFLLSLTQIMSSPLIFQVKLAHLHYYRIDFDLKRSIKTQFKRVFSMIFAMFSMNVFIIVIREINVAMFSFIEKQRCPQL